MKFEGFFDVCCRHLNINQHILCEASAGTGKTFTIEHLFIRRLLTAPKSIASEIAVLTFTNAVASELVVRLKRALVKAITDLRTQSNQAPDYLRHLIENGQSDDAANALEGALDELDFAPIDTIHGFCFRCLQEYASLGVKGNKGAFVSGYEIGIYVEEFFRSQLKDEGTLHAELKVLLSHYNYDFKELREAIINSLWDERQEAIEPVGTLVQGLRLAAQSVTLDEFEASLLDATQHYKGIRSRDGEIKEELGPCFDAILLFIKNPASDEAVRAIIENPLFARAVFRDLKVKSEGMIFSAVEYLKTIEPILQKLAQCTSVFERLKTQCRAYVSRELEKIDKYSMHELLVCMERKLEDERFVDYVKKRFSCVIVDEFQDTDIHQWNIIQTLFVDKWPGSLYLVGDPKQAIYSFRHADVYCYMQAKDVKNQLIVTLTKNYRASDELIAGLNTLFCGPHSSSLFVLPKRQESLEVPLITPGHATSNFTDLPTGAIHFFEAAGHLRKKRSWPTLELEYECFYPFLAREIIKLKSCAVTLSDIAILVSDRHQAKSLEMYLESRGISTLSWRKKSVIDSEAHQFLLRLVAALKNVKDQSALIELVMHKPFLYSSQAVRELKVNLEFWAEHVTLLTKLKHGYEKASVASLLEAFLQSVWPAFDVTMKELLWQDQEFLLDLGSLVEYTVQNRLRIEVFEECLQNLSNLPSSEKEQFTSRYDPQQNAVQILTMHASKGLEFPFVFALGVASRNSPPDVNIDSKELDAEKLRLFYVACTRAKKKLYLPIATELDAKEIAPGTKSPIELFLDTISVDALVTQSSGCITCEKLIPASDHSRLVSKSEKATRPLKLDALPYAAPSYYLTSFSKLNDRSVLAKKTITEKSLPAGIEAGILLHTLLQEVMQNELDVDEVSVAKRLEATHFEEHVTDVLDILKRATTLQLGDVNLQHATFKRCEVPFYVCEKESRFIRGSIDLYFEYNNKFYLLDWKSNLLESYCKAALQNEVEMHGYALQAKIYSAAFCRHLGKQSEDFGGFFFVFLRGLKNNEGVLFLEPSVEPVYAR